MQKIINTKVLAILIATLIFSMSQEAPAQRKKTKSKQTTTTENKTVPPTISYTVSMSKPATHLLEVEMRLNSTSMPEQAELKMPVWTPGSYLIREYARTRRKFHSDRRGRQTFGVAQN